MTELTNIFARSIKDLTLISQLPSDLTVLDQVKIPVGNLPAGVNGCEALSFQQLRIVIASDLNKNITNLEQTVNSKISENQKLVDSKLLETKIAVNSKLLETKTAVDSSLAQNKSYTDQALLQLSTQATKFYPTLALANADISSLAVNQAVNIGEVENGGLWYKATADATSLMKSPYDPLEQVKNIEFRYVDSSDSENIYEWKDVNGLLLLRLSKTGKLKSPQIDNIERTLSDIEFVSDVLAQQQSSKLLKFCDLNNTELGYVDGFGRWILSGVDVLDEIQDLKTNGTTSSNVSRLKQYVLQPPKSLVQIYVTSNDALPLDKSYKAQGKVEVHIDGQSFSSYVTLEVQGSSSVGYPKKNYTLGFFSDIGLTQSLKVQVGDVPAHDEWVFKANYVDSSNCRNLGGNNLWEAMVQSRTSSNGYKREVDQYYVGKTGNDALITNAVGHVVGYPCVMYVNDEFYGVGSFNIGKKYFNYNLDRTKPTQIQIDWGGSQCDLTKMYDNYISGALDYKGEPVFEFKSPKKVTNATLACLSAWDAFAASPQSSFTQNADTFLNRQNAIDYYLFSDLTFNYDGLGKNFQFVSWNGVQFNFMPYDLDSIFGSNWSGTGTVPANNALDIGDLPQNSRAFWTKLKTAYLADMKARYKQLRDAKIFHEDNIHKICTDLASKYPRDLILTEFAKWPNLPSKTYSNVNQIVSWSKQRLAYLDTQYEYIA